MLTKQLCHHWASLGYTESTNVIPRGIRLIPVIEFCYTFHQCLFVSIIMHTTELTVFLCGPSVESKKQQKTCLKRLWDIIIKQRYKLKNWCFRSGTIKDFSEHIPGVARFVLKHSVTTHLHACYTICICILKIHPPRALLSIRETWHMIISISLTADQYNQYLVIKRLLVILNLQPNAI